jgi:hypothetical protein
VGSNTLGRTKRYQGEGHGRNEGCGKFLTNMEEIEGVVGFHFFVGNGKRELGENVIFTWRRHYA